MNHIKTDSVVTNYDGYRSSFVHLVHFNISIFTFLLSLVSTAFS